MNIRYGQIGNHFYSLQLFRVDLEMQQAGGYRMVSLLSAERLNLLTRISLGSLSIWINQRFRLKYNIFTALYLIFLTFVLLLFDQDEVQATDLNRGQSDITNRTETSQTCQLIFLYTLC